MRIRAVVAWGCVALALILGFIGEAAGQDWMFVVAGLFWVTAIVLGVSLLPFWRRVVPEVPPMPRLFRRPEAGQRWCTVCGSPAPADATCPVCGAPSKKRGKGRGAKAAS